MFFSESEWMEKFKSYLPNWFFTKEQTQVAILQGVAFSLSETQKQIDEETSQLFVGLAEGIYLDALGQEVDVIRKFGEFDSLYRSRIRSLPNKSDFASIKFLIDQVLYNGESNIIEFFKSQLFFNREVYFNRGSVFIDEVINVFIVEIPRQRSPFTAFFDRDAYASRGEFFASISDSDYVFRLIQEIIDENKALGTQYYLIEKN